MLLLLAGANFADGKIAASACPPSCATNELLELLDNYCSDKARGTRPPGESRPLSLADGSTATRASARACAHGRL